jgi:enamine deaminase RidA (YjgF/YER057c/UK114 family)
VPWLEPEEENMPRTTISSGSPYETRATLTIIEAALRQAGASLSDVIRTRIYLADVSHWEAVGRAHGEVFGDIRPASTMIEVSRFIDPDWLVEIEADAVIT